MSYRAQLSPRPLAVALIMLGACFAAVDPAALTADQVNSKAAAVPRTPDGKPDLQGYWNFSTPTPLERPAELAGKEVFTDEEYAALLKEAAPLTAGAAGDRDQRAADPVTDVELAYNEVWSERGRPLKRTSLIVDPPDGRLPPMVPGAQKRAAGSAGPGRTRGTDSWEDRSLWERCISRSELPRIPGTYNNNLLLLQTREHVVIHYEMIHETRIIPLDGRPHIASAVRQWLGDSRGRWEGDTLVVETANFSPKATFRGASPDMRLTERFTRIDADTLDYQFTVTDPATWTKPWTAVLPHRKVPGVIFEYACHEGNYGLANILSGARALEGATGAGRPDPR